MSVMKLKLPSGKFIYDGSLVKLGDNTSPYTLKYDSQKCDWYIQSIDSNTRINLQYIDFSNMNVLNDGSEIYINPRNAHCCHPQHNQQEKFTKQDKYVLTHVWISVGTMTERDSLPDELLKEGLIVQVVHGSEDTPEYFRYDGQEFKTWDSFNLNDSDVQIIQCIL